MHYLDQDEHEQPPPFHFGTHYSCAAYVVNYLIRLEPFTRLALTLPGGKFDLADRLFQSVAASWRSASRDNLQDVRELIPEFFYLPDFLLNKNAFNYGVTQHGKIVHHVTLPPWAKGDPTRFVRMQRKVSPIAMLRSFFPPASNAPFMHPFVCFHLQALESDFVSRNLHKWVDLVFGYKQRGREAVTALNTFVHVTYEGAVDLDTIEDPVVRESTLAQIHNFGQTPSRLEKAPFPSRNVASILKERNIDLNALAYLSHLTPSYCITGAPHKVFMKTASWDSYKLAMSGQEDAGVGDVFMSKGPIIGVGMNCIFVNASTYIRYDGRSNGISFHVATTSTRYREVDKVLSIIDDMHSSPITIARISSDGNFLITTCLDSTVRVWRVKTNPRSFERSYTLRLQGTLSGHEGVKVTCMDICSVFGTVVTCDAKGVILLWNLRTSSFLRRLSTTDNTRSPPAISVSLNRKNGNIVTLVGSSLKVFDINGIPVATLPPEFKFPMNNMPTCAISTSCQEWMDGIVAITGHMNGDVRMWSIDYDRGLLVFRHVIPDKVHDSSITCLRCLDNQKNLLIGDSSGRISMASTMQLDSLSLSELSVVAEEIRMLSEVGSTR
jgi:WD40 repeat protein